MLNRFAISLPPTAIAQAKPKNATTPNTTSSRVRAPASRLRQARWVARTLARLMARMIVSITAEIINTTSADRT